MSFIEKIKLLMVAREPVQQLFGEIKDAPSQWKSLHFWVTLLASLGLLANTFVPFMPMIPALFLTASLTALYNICHGLDQTNQNGVLPLLQNASTWTTILGGLSTFLTLLHAGGANYGWIGAAIAVIGGTGLANQNLTAQQPTDTK